MAVQLLNVNSSVNIAWKTKCYISKSKLILCEYNAFYYSEIAFVDFTLHEIKQGIVFFETPGIYRVAQKKVYAFDLVQRKNYKCYIAEINVAVFIKV